MGRGHEARREPEWQTIACVSASLALLAVSFTSSVSAQEQGAALYEAEGAQRAMIARQRTLEPSPRGKRIAFVDVVRDEVFVEQELAIPILLPRQAPTWPNAFHWLTEEDIVRRELLLGVGDAYDQARIDESERNLRALNVFSLVRIVAVQAPRSTEVGLLVYTRDMWSLRFETAFAGAGDAYRLRGQVVERNFLGRDKTLMLRAGLEPRTASVGQLFLDPRVLGTKLTFSESVDVIFDRNEGDVEGSYGELTLGLQRRHLRQRWSWGLSGSYHDYVARTLRGQAIAGFRSLPEGGLEPCLPGVQVGEPRNDDCMRAVWDESGQALSFGVGYHLGLRYTQSFGFGVGYSSRDASANAETMLRDDQRDAFARDVLPRTRRQVYPSFTYSLSVPDYVVFHDLGTFGQSESVRAGPEASFGTSLPLEAFGSSTNSVRFSSGLGYVLAGGEGLLEAATAAGTRLEEGRVVDQTLNVLLRGATPAWLAGRLVGYASWAGRRRDTGKTTVTLGGDNGLRGYPSAAFLAIGGERLRGNLEYRTLPLVVASIHVGGVAFYDFGSVYTSLRTAQLNHSVGAGVRLLFPQINRTPFGIDVGVPLDGRGFGVLLSYASEQAVPLTAYDDAVAASGP
jgi:hypothetical protein